MFVLSEVKKQEGELLQKYDLPGFSLTERLRENTRSGGLAVYIRDGLKVPVSVVKEPSPEVHAWMDAERVWVKVEGSKKLAICSLYLRRETPVGSAFHSSNVMLLDQIHEEARTLREDGFMTAFQGDFNAHIGNTRPYGVPNNVHGVNNNGRLVHQFMRDSGAVLVNGHSWTTLSGKAVSAGGMWTYGRIREDSYHFSLLDLLIVDEDVLQYISTMDTSVSEALGISSDHSPIVWTIDLG